MDKQESGGTATETTSARRTTAHDPMAAEAAKQEGESLKSAADPLRAHAPHDGLAGQVTDTVTSGIKQAATHLQQQASGGMIDGLVAIAKRYPVQTLLLGIGGGFLLSRLRRE